jgi:hypothetical protein
VFVGFSREDEKLRVNLILKISGYYETCAGTYTFDLKERVRKHIHSDSEGEMHYSTDVYHAS